MRALNDAFKRIFRTDQNLISNDPPRIQHMLDLEAKRQGVKGEHNRNRTKSIKRGV